MALEIVVAQKSGDFFDFFQDLSIVHYFRQFHFIKFSFILLLFNLIFNLLHFILLNSIFFLILVFFYLYIYAYGCLCLCFKENMNKFQKRFWRLYYK